MEELQQHIPTNWTNAANFSSSFMTKKIAPMDSNFAATFISSGTVSPWVTRPNPINIPSSQPEEQVPKRKASAEEFVEAGKNAWSHQDKQNQQAAKRKESKGDDGSMNGLYKTELCRSFSETGTCRYGSKCQFAHGIHELMPVSRHPKYKTEVCKSFHTYGTCPYGTRCRFIHSRPGDLPVSQAPQQQQQQQGWSTSWSQPANTSPEITPIGAGHRVVAPSSSPILEPVAPVMRPTPAPVLAPVVQVPAPAPVDPAPMPQVIAVPPPTPIVAAPAPVLAPAPVPVVQAPVPVPPPTIVPPAPVLATPQPPAVVAPIVIRSDAGSDLLSLSLQEEELVTATATGEVVIPLNSPPPKKRLPVFQELC